MRNIVITINADTELSVKQVEEGIRYAIASLVTAHNGVYTLGGYSYNGNVPPLNITGLSIEVMSVDEFTKLDEMIAEQKQWIADHGGDLAGYIKTYGSKNDPEYKGNGGERIYAADTAELHRLQDLLSSRLLNRAHGSRLDPLPPETFKARRQEPPEKFKAPW